MHETELTFISPETFEVTHAHAILQTTDWSGGGWSKKGLNLPEKTC